MTEFAETEMRHRCRNPHCRSKLPTPVSNKREAFCTKGCHSSFYLHRCLACEGPMKRKREDQKVCRKAKCRNAWRAGSGFGCYAVSPDAKLASKTPDFIDSKSPIKPDRAWRIVAGPPLTPNQFHCATVPDGADCQWKGGEYERIEARNRRSLDAHFNKLDSTAADSCSVCGRDDDLVDYKKADHWVTTCRECRAQPPAPPRSRPELVTTDDDGLDIPAFLRRAAKPNIDDQKPKAQVAGKVAA